MKLLILFGPPAVGKTAVGEIIESKTDFKLFHNHMIMDAVMHIFGVGTPAEDRLSRDIRSLILTEAAEANLDVIFTYVWNFGRDKGKHNIDAYKKIYESRGGQVIFVELVAPLAVRVERANGAHRKQIKLHAPNGEQVARLETTLKFDSPQPFFYPEVYQKINTQAKTPSEIATEVIEYVNRVS